MSEEWEALLPGTSYFVGYSETGEGYQLRVGDRVEILFVFAIAEINSAVCDSLRLTASLGTGDLPIGVDWALLHVKRNGIHWLSLRRETADPRFTRCGPDSLGVYHIRATILDADTSGRLDSKGMLAKARAGVSLYQVAERFGVDEHRSERYADAAVFLADVVVSKPQNLLLRSVYAGALQGSGQCHDYARQTTILAKAGLNNRATDHEEGYCLYYSHQGEALTDFAYERLRMKTTDAESLLRLWQHGVDLTVRKYHFTWPHGPEFLALQVKRMDSLPYDEKLKESLREYLTMVRGKLRGP